jgi:plastocyanin
MRRFTTAVVLALGVTAAGWIGAAAPASAAQFDIHISGGAPSPSTLTIDPGDTIVYVNDDDVSHTIFADGRPQDDPIPPGGQSNQFGPFDAGGQQATYGYRVDATGPSGTIILRGTVPTTTTSPPPPVPPSTTAPAPATIPETTTTEVATTVVPSTTAATNPSSTRSPSTIEVAAAPARRSSGSTNLGLALGIAFLAIGLVGITFALTWRGFRARRRQ